MNTRQVFEEFKNIGRNLFLCGCAPSHSGNLSLLLPDGRLAITRSGSLLSDLQADDIVYVGLEQNEPILGASSELSVHRAVILKTGKIAVVHAHCPYTLAMTSRYEFTFPDAEYKTKFGHPLLVGNKEQFVAGAFADDIAAALENHGVCVVEGHGVFAAGVTLKEAYCYLTALEAGSKQAYLEKTLP